VVCQFRERKLEATYPYLWLDALYLKVWQNHRIVSQAVVIAIGVKETGEREILGFDIGASEEEADLFGVSPKSGRTRIARSAIGLKSMLIRG